jgi:hypothetical protein
MNYSRPFLFLLFLLYVVPLKTQAIIPPDVLISAGAQFAQFFSFIAFMIGGLFMSIAFGLSPYIQWVKNHLRVTIASIVGLVIVIVGSMYFVQYQSNMTQPTQSSTSTTTIMTATTTSTEEFIEVVDTTNAALGDKQFRSSSLFLYATGTKPMYLELDFNRRQKPDGTFLHYYYVHGWIAGVDVVDYVTFTSSSSFPQARGFLGSYRQIAAVDASSRRSYQGTVTINGASLMFDTATFVGDFVTKDKPDYTRLQSVDTAQVTYNDTTTTVHALSEVIYAEDYSTKIFFPGSSDVEAITHQFILWDAEGNFYLLDNSQVFSDTPEYPSHTWLLHKDGVDGSSRKSFTASLYSTLLQDQAVSWQFTMPDYANASVRVEPYHYIDREDLQIRDRIMVAGTITDTQGIRPISGVLHYIQR